MPDLASLSGLRTRSTLRRTTLSDVTEGDLRPCVTRARAPARARACMANPDPNPDSNLPLIFKREPSRLGDSNPGPPSSSPSSIESAIEFNSATESAFKSIIKSTAIES
jgi:hypothetical protein